MANVTIAAASVVPPTTSSTTHVTPASTIAGEAIAAGETVAKLTADGRYYRADTDDTTKNDVEGFAGNSAAVAGQRIDIINASPALEVGTHGVAVGTALFQSATPGKICPLADLTTGAFPTLVAYTASATTLQVVIAKSANAKP